MSENLDTGASQAYYGGIDTCTVFTKVHLPMASNVKLNIKIAVIIANICSLDKR